MIAQKKLLIYDLAIKNSGIIRMKFIDLERQYQRCKANIQLRIEKVLNHGQYIKGPEITELEEKLAKKVGVKHCVGLASGTTALQAALMALKIEPGDEVITPAFSFFAAAEVILFLGAKPVFVDIDAKSYLADPQKIQQAITPKTKAIIPVNLYGQCADYDQIKVIADRHNIPIIEDAAQSFGAVYKGRASGSLGAIACTSFFPAKPLGCFGDSGACFTDDDALAQQMRLIIDHGQQQRYQHTELGFNGRMDTLQAAILLEKLELFDEEMELRQQLAQWYAEALGNEIKTPYVMPHNVSAYAQYTLEFDNRDAMEQALTKAGIPTAIHYPKGMHQQSIMLKHGAAVALPITEEKARKVLSVPFYPYLKKSEVLQVAQAIKIS
jgi:UDP-2-acetamido-2-deoxy-ribo-hexuluronate aminotransferase